MANSGRSTFLAILALIVGISGAGLGAYSTFFQPPTAGPPGDDGEDGEDAGGIVVGILDPDFHDIISGLIEIRALIAGSDNYSTSILKNGTEIATEVPFEWDTTSSSDGWWNITVKAIDVPSGNETQDYVEVYVLNAIEDIPIYYCASESEINDALSDIGTGSGTIMITNNIVLSNSITLDGGGSYVIQGIAPSITLDCGGDRSAIRVEITQSCLIRDLTIDATDVVNSITNIIFISDTLTRVENIRIFGDSDREGRGIYVDCADVWVTNCHIEEVLYGIFGLSSDADYLHVSDNTVINCDDGTIGHGIYLGGDYSTCDNNYVAYCQTGIFAFGFQCTVSNNVLYGNLNYGMQVVTDYSTVSGNSIRGYSPISADDTYGIYVNSGSDYNVITGNLIHSYLNTGSGTGFGISIVATSCDDNTIVGNTVLNCDTAISDSGTNTYIASNNLV